LAKTMRRSAATASRQHLKRRYPFSLGTCVRLIHC